MDIASPKTNDKLFGHDEAEDGLLRAFESNTLPHGLLICGPRGIGKATLAHRFARFLLSVSQDSEDAKDAARNRIANGSHTDFLVIEPLFDEKKEEFARDITVDQAREIAQFLSLTPAEGDWRVVIVDSIDALGANAANAILKILEEPPPQALLMLVSHNPGKLLPTIRSRCRMLKLAPLPEKAFARAMMHVLPHVPQERLTALAQLSGFSPGIAAQCEGQGALLLYGQILELLATLPHLDSRKLHGFADAVATGQVHANWQLFSLLMQAALERASKRAAGMVLVPISEEEGEVLAMLASLHNAGIWAQKWQQASDQFSLAQRLHLDYKQLVIAFFHSLAGTESFEIGYAA
jgi:DNA polymerase-3 subunit delta'